MKNNLGDVERCFSAENFDCRIFGSQTKGRIDLRKTHKTTEVSGLGFIEALTLLFIGLKLTGHITWKWLWVLSPMWITLSIAFVLALLIVAIDAVRDRLNDDEEDETV